MNFSKAKNSNVTEEAKGQSLLGFLFVPDVKGTISPIRESLQMFVTLLAMVFASQGLFPRNHPAILGVKGARLGLFEVLSTARRNLVFTKENLSKIILFMAVVVILGGSALAVFLGLASMFVGKAHASTFFSPVDPACSPFTAPCQDIATNWLQYLFNGQTMYNYMGTYGQIVPQSPAVQTALMAALGFYSEAIMVVAAVILFYHLATMIVNTAHHGVVLGKHANQVWAPIRLVFAVGLLIPVAGGLNTGQYIVIQMAQWGSNLAGQVWNQFLTSMVAQAGNGKAASAPYARKAVYDTLMQQVCATSYNSYLYGYLGSPTAAVSFNGISFTTLGGDTTGAAATARTNAFDTIDTATPSCSPVAANWAYAGGNRSDPSVGGTDLPPIGTLPAVTSADGSTAIGFDLPAGSKALATTGVCGHVTWPATPVLDPTDPYAQTVQGVVSATAGTAYSNMLSNVQTYVQAFFPYFINACVGGMSDQTIPANNGTTTSDNFDMIVGQYEDDIQGGLNSAASGFSAAMTAIAATSGAQGWASAGAWFNTVAREQSDLMDVASSIPATEGPAMHPVGEFYYDKYVLPSMNAFEGWLGQAAPTTLTMPSTNLSPMQQQVLLAQAGLVQSKDSTNGSWFDKTFQFIDLIAHMYGVWQEKPSGAGLVFSLGVSFEGANPLAEIVALGQANLKASRELFDTFVEVQFVSGTASGAGDKTMSLLKDAVQALGGREPSSVQAAFMKGTGALGGTLQMFGKAGEKIGPLLMMASMIFFTAGFMLAYYLPLIPFFYFLFNVVTWIISIFEAVIAVPLVALAHLTPNGEGLPGDQAKQAYYFIFNIFLRPVLMIFGLIVSLLVFFIAVSYMNMLYLQAVAGSGGLAQGSVAFSRFVYSFLYVIVIVMCANTCFKLITFLPDNAMRWMGGSQYSGLGDDPTAIEGKLAVGSSLMENRIMGSVGMAARELGYGTGVTAATLAEKATPKGVPGYASAAVGGALATTVAYSAALNPNNTSSFVSNVTSQLSHSQVGSEALAVVKGVGGQLNADMQGAVLGLTGAGAKAAPSGNSNTGGGGNAANVASGVPSKPDPIDPGHP